MDKNLDKKYLKLLAEKYPSAAAAKSEIINLTAIMSLPKGTEYFFSDIHGEYEAFLNLLRSASGTIMDKIRIYFSDSMTAEEQENFAHLIYFPEETLKLYQAQGLDNEKQKILIFRLIRLCKELSSKYTRSKVRKKLPADYGYAIEELLNVDTDEMDKKRYYDEIINSIKTNTTDDIYSYYRNIDILLIDDIQFLFGKEKSSEMFFHIFNEIINSNHQIVITSDKMPDELQGIEERLISRFKSGLSFGIDPPEFETAKAILEKKIENLGNTDLIITDDVLDFMVMNYCNDIRSLEGQLKRLFFCSIMEQTNYIDMNFASEVFKDQKTIKKAQEPLTKEFILKTTAEFYYLTISQIISKNRTRNLVTPREICMYLMRELLDVTFSEIGMTFSNRDHSTIMKACKRVETKIKKDPDYKLAVDKLKQKLGTM